MSSFFSIKAVRLLLAFSVSIWMAGGCLFGCSNAAMGAGIAHEADNTGNAIVSGESCHAAASSHDFGSSQKPKKRTANNAKHPKGVPSFTPGPRGMMKDCPLAVSATAVASKNSGHLPEPGRGPVAVLPLIENKTAQLVTFSLTPIPPNRGPTYLRCCVFLI
jgi:hypothetical protein